MKYIGIDYSLIEGRPEFWIYFSTNPVPVEYTHKIAAYRINKGNHFKVLIAISAKMW